MLIGVAGLSMAGEVENIVAMNGTSNSLNFKSKIDDMAGFKSKPWPFVNENEGRLLMATMDTSKKTTW